MVNNGYDDGFHDGFNNNLVGGIPTPLKNDGVKISWGYELPNIWKNKSHVPNHQPAMVWIITQMIFWSVDVCG